MAKPLFRNRRLAVIFTFGFLLLVLFYSVQGTGEHLSVAPSWRYQKGTFLRRISSAQVDMSPLPTPVSNANTSGFMPLNEAEEMCASLDMPVWPNRTQRRKIYDLTLINTELDWLEIRLNEIWQEVDYFVIVEATRTFTNKPKKLYLQEELRRRNNRFEKFGSQIIYHILDIDIMKVDYGALGSHKDREKYQRNANFEIFLPTLINEQQPLPGDVLIISDIDELPKPRSLLPLRNCDFGTLARLHSPLHYYSFTHIHPRLDWARPNAIMYTLPHTPMMTPEEVRAAPLATTHLWNAAWHCSCCFGTVAEMLAKMGSFAHAHLDTEENRKVENVVRRVREGRDVFGREELVYEKVKVGEGEERVDMPSYVWREWVERGRFGWMVSREGEGAGFEDWEEIKRNLTLAEG